MERFGAWPIYIRSSILHHLIVVVVVVVVHAAFDFSKFVTATLHYLFLCPESDGPDLCTKKVAKVLQVTNRFKFENTFFFFL